jgi:hypothetical protein
MLIKYSIITCLICFSIVFKTSAQKATIDFDSLFSNSISPYRQQVFPINPVDTLRFYTFDTFRYVVNSSAFKSNMPVIDPKGLFIMPKLMPKIDDEMPIKK